MTLRTPLLGGATGAGRVPLATAVATSAPGAAPTSAPPTFLGPLHTITRVASTVPGNGDLNPYGVAVVPRTLGRLHRGDVLVSNFNDRTNAQGTGTSVVAVSPTGRRALFARVDPHSLPGSCVGGVGLTTALGVTASGWVVVGSLPSRDGTAATARAGCRLVLDDRGRVRETLSGHGINGPWDMTLAEHRDRVDLFVSNVLNGTVRASGKVVHRGTVLRITLGLRGDLPPERLSTTTVGSGFAERSDPEALVVGPTGVGLGRRRHPVRRGHGGPPAGRPPGRLRSAHQRRARPHRERGRRARRATGTGHSAERAPRHGQCRHRQPRRDDAGRPPGRRTHRGHQRLTARRGCPLRAGASVPTRRLSRQRRHEHPGAAALTDPDAAGLFPAGSGKFTMAQPMGSWSRARLGRRQTARAEEVAGEEVVGARQLLRRRSRPWYWNESST